MFLTKSRCYTLNWLIRYRMASLACSESYKSTLFIHWWNAVVKLFVVTKWNMIFLTDCCDGRKRDCRAHWLFLIWWTTLGTPIHAIFFFALLLNSCSFITRSCFLSFLSSYPFRVWTFSFLIFLQPSPSLTLMTQPVWRSSWILGPPFQSCSPSCVSGFPRCSIRLTWLAMRWGHTGMPHHLFFWPFWQLAEIVKLIFFCEIKMQYTFR